MAGPRIRSVKPEWLEDEHLLRAGSHARVLSIALILVADDYGRGRCIPEALAAQVFPFERESSRVFRESLARLSAMHFVGVYRVREQQYFEIRNWTRHQRVDKPGKPRVPAPNGSDFIELESSREPREDFPNRSGDSRESLAPDRDQDLDQEGEVARACAIPVLGSTRSATGSTGSTTPPREQQGSQNVTNSAGNGIAVPTGRLSTPDASPSRLWEIWQEVAELQPVALSDQDEKLLAAASVQLGKRDSRDPEGFFARMVAAYIASEHQRGRTLELVFFVRDFPKWAERVARATSTGSSSSSSRPEWQPFPELEEVPQ